MVPGAGEALDCAGRHHERQGRDLAEHLIKEVEEMKWLLARASDTGMPLDSARRR
jgi:hypothetical protein